jgi:hypothetical protein
MEPMRIKTIRLPSSEAFPCSRRDVKRVFSAEEVDWVSFGNPIRTFRLDSRAAGTPILGGPVAISLTVNRERQAYLCVFPIAKSEYPEAARAELVNVVLPRFAEWLRVKQRRPDTAVLGVEEIIAEWNSGSHRVHELRYL